MTARPPFTVQRLDHVVIRALSRSPIPRHTRTLTTVTIRPRRLMEPLTLFGAKGIEAIVSSFGMS